jgi:hypothetical protein
MWLRNIVRPKLLGWIVIAYAGFSLMNLGPLSFLVILRAGQPSAAWLIFLDKALLALLILGGIGLSLRKLWGRWFVISSLSTELIAIAIITLRYMENIVFSINQHASWHITGLITVIPALLILLAALVANAPQSEADTSRAVDEAGKARLLSMLYTVHLCLALLGAVLGGLYPLKDFGVVGIGTLEMLGMLLIIPLVMSLPVIAVFSLFGIGLSVKYKDKGLAILSTLALSCLMLFGVFVAGLKVPEYVLDTAVVLYIILSTAFSIRWFYVGRRRLRQEPRAHHPIDVNAIP